MSIHKRFTIPRNREHWKEEHPHVVEVAEAILEILNQSSEFRFRIRQEWTYVSRIPIYVDGREKLLDCEPPHEPRKAGCKKTYLHIYPLHGRDVWAQKWGAKLKEKRIGSLQVKTNRLRISLEEPSQVNVHRVVLTELLSELMARIEPSRK
jgi:hypothetical protein